MSGSDFVIEWGEDWCGFEDGDGGERACEEGRGKAPFRWDEGVLLCLFAGCDGNVRGFVLVWRGHFEGDNGPIELC